MGNLNRTSKSWTTTTELRDRLTESVWLYELSDGMERDIRYRRMRALQIACAIRGVHVDLAIEVKGVPCQVEV